MENNLDDPKNIAGLSTLLKDDDIVKNKADQDKKKGEIEAQKKVVGEIDKQLKSVE